jgi:hypothetical protein
MNSNKTKSRLTFRNPNKSNPCPACGGTTSKCRLTDEGPILCGNSFTASAPAGYRMGALANDFWQIFVPSNEGQSEEERQNWIAEQDRRAAVAAEEEKKFQERVLSEHARHQYFEKLANSLTLCEVAKADLDRRSVGIAAAEKWGFRSVEAGHDISALNLPDTVPGIAAGGKRLSNGAGYLCPAKSPDGLTTGYQIRLHDGGGYRWLSSDSASQHLPNRENPITVARPLYFRPTSNAAIGMCEGLLKPFIAAQNLNQIIVGAAGGQLASSPQTLERYLIELQAETGFNHIIFYPDAGSIVNPHVLAQYYKCWELVKSWGYSLKLLWYGQDNKHDFKDIDEYSLDQIYQLRAKLISDAEFWDMSKGMAEAEMQRLVNSLGYQSQGAALRGIGYSSSVTPSPLSVWRAVLALQERKLVVRLEGQVSMLTDGISAELESELSQWAAVHGGSFSTENGASGLASKKLAYVLNKLDSF